MSENRFIPTPGYCYQSRIRILPREDYKPQSLHTTAIPSGSTVRSIRIEWCPICLGRSISEKTVSGKPVWHCDECEHEW